MSDAGASYGHKTIISLLLIAMFDLRNLTDSVSLLYAVTIVNNGLTVSLFEGTR
jgi:hypothetical protein